MTRDEATKMARSIIHLKGKTFNEEENELLQPPNEILEIIIRKIDKDLYVVEIFYYESRTGIAFYETYNEFLKTHHVKQ